MTTILHNPRCSKSRAAVELLESRGVDFEVVKYLDNPPSEKELTRIVKLLGVSPETIVRKGEKLYKELGLADKKLSNREWIAMLVNNPKLIERPIVIHDEKAAVGRPLENIEAILDS
ncbi:arsenate reductase [Rhodopirellula rubra]|uniref:Arsenate reductase n=1 Tax=Aporhodopirellula rubra TaxID=980271 RepID=A0A7W5H8Z2_9BACT|nr:arsenate reductase (glutaredoxin) [Aporhodopirellula rubra]MBB3209590.1 arsenate reductase [Aporhodopirellula rubra]